MAKDKQKDLPVVTDPTQVPFLADLEQDAGKGFEGADQESYAIPFLIVLQALSPQLNSDDPAYNEDAKAGMVLNTVSGELYDGESGLVVVPCSYKRVVIQWGDRDSGGGFMGVHPVNTPLFEKTVRNERQQDVLPDGSYLVDTRQHYVLVQGRNGNWSPAIVAMASTQNKKSKKWMTQMSQVMVPGKQKAFNPPMFSQMYRLKTIGESNAKGNWKGWVVEYMGLVNSTDLLAHGRSFHEKVAEGSVQPAHESVGAADGSGDGTESF